MLFDSHNTKLDAHSNTLQKGLETEDKLYILCLSHNQFLFVHWIESHAYEMGQSTSGAATHTLAAAEVAVLTLFSWGGRSRTWLCMSVTWKAKAKHCEFEARLGNIMSHPYQKSRHKFKRYLCCSCYLKAEIAWGTDSWTVKRAWLTGQGLKKISW